MEVQQKQQLANEIVTALVMQLERNGNVDTGRLKNSIEAEIHDDKIIILMEETWPFIEFGTVPHVIRPTNKKALKFNVGTKDIFAKEVHHPGTRPSPFIRPVMHDIPMMMQKYAE